MNQKPIGIFDSGIGGLTVFKALKENLPQEEILYLGDTAHLPYGSKTRKTIERLSFRAINFLLSRGAKMVVIACNTVSSLSLDWLKKKFPAVPLVNVLEPGVKKAIICTKNKKVGIIGTEATVKSKSYPRLINKISPEIRVFSRSSPLLVSLVEEGWIKNKCTYKIASFYLKPLLKREIDTLILGCTHYPLLKGLFKKIVGEKVTLVDSAQEVAKEAKRILKEKRITSRNPRGSSYFFVTDNPQRFKRVGRIFLREEINHVEEIDLD